MIRKQDLPYSLRILEDYFNEYLSKRFTIPSRTNEFGEECFEEIDVDQFCLSSKQVEEGRKFWFYQGAYDRDRDLPTKDSNVRDFLFVGMELSL